MINRVQRIKEKGFNMNVGQEDSNVYANTFETKDFSKIKIGLKTLNDASINLGSLKSANSVLADINTVNRAIQDMDLESMREISDFFYKVSGIYSRLCRYMAYLYKLDWMVTPYIYSNNMKNEKVEEGFYQVLSYLDNFEIKRNLQDISLKVIRNGCYYGYVVADKQSINIQELPIKYCRSRLFAGGRPVVEFNMKFFDDYFRDEEQRKKMLKIFPPEFEKGYELYKKGKLVSDNPRDKGGWYLLDVDSAFKFNVSGSDCPMFISVIPDIIGLDEAKELDRKKMMQNLLKILIQKMPIDKNGDLVFDVDEATALHNNAVNMLSRAVGVDVLTSFADVSVADMSDRSMANAVDELSKAERSIYTGAGVSQMQFNTDGNLALEKSIANDEASIYNLVLQFENFLNKILKPFNTNSKKIFYRLQILPTTIYNYKDLSKIYKEQTQLGYSKMLPQIALGQSQSSILANAKFENEILDLVKVFVPPMSSSTMSSETIRKGGDPTEEKTPGRKEKADDEKSEKTIQNRESMS